MANIRHAKLALALALSMGGSAAVAGPSITIGDGTGAPGGSASVELTFEAGADVASADLTFDYDETILTPDISSCGGAIGDATAVCNVNMADGEISVLINPPFAIPIPSTPSGSLGTVSFAIDGSAAENSTSALTISSESYTTGGGAGVEPDVAAAEREGTITIATPTGPSLSASGDVSITTAVNTAGTDTFSFTAVDGEVTGISCSGSGDSEIGFSGSVPGSLPAEDSFTITASCQSGAAGSFSAGYTCDYDGGSASASVACTVDTGLAVPAFDPDSGGTLIIGNLAPGSGGSRTVTFSEVANQGTGYTVSGCGFPAGSDFSVSPTSVDVPSGSSRQVSVSVGPVSSVVSDTLSCDVTANGEVSEYSIRVTVGFRPLTVPTLQQWGMILMALALAGFGIVTLRRRDA